MDALRVFEEYRESVSDLSQHPQQAELQNIPDPPHREHVGCLVHKIKSTVLGSKTETVSFLLRSLSQRVMVGFFNLLLNAVLSV